MTDVSPRQGRRLLQIGVALLLFTSFEGLPFRTLPRRRLGALFHTLSALLAVLLLSFGFVWHRLQPGTTAWWKAFWFLIYSGLGIVTAFPRNATMVVAYSSAPTGIIAFLLIFWGLRRAPSTVAR